jgi:hypothetical protein
MGSKVSTIIKLVFVAIIFLIFLTVILPGDHKRINAVKDTNIGWSNYTYGTVLNKTCTGKKWKVYTSTSGNDVVEFDGKLKGGKKITIKWVSLGNKLDNYKVAEIDLDNRALDPMNMMNEIYELAENY